MSKYKLIKIQAKGWGILSALVYEIKGDRTVVCGGNGDGKSTMLDVIPVALTGKLVNPVTGSSSNPKDMVNWESDRKWAELMIYVMGEDGRKVEVLRKVKADGSSTVTCKVDGKKMPFPKEFLSKIASSPKSFDPTFLSRMRGQDRINEAKNLLGINTIEEENEYQRIFEERTVINREIRNAKSRIEDFDESEIDSYPDQLPDAPRTAESYTTKIDRAKKIDEEIKQLAKKLYELKKEREEIGDVELLKKKAEDATKEVAQFRERQRQYTIKQNWKVYKSDLDSAESKLEECELKLEAAKIKIKRKILKADIPDNLEIGKDDIVYNGIPFSKLSTGEQLKVASMIIKRSNNNLSLMIIRDASLLDNKGLTELFKFAQSLECHIMVEIVGSVSGNDSLEFQAGKIVKKKKKKKEAKKITTSDLGFE